MDRSRSESAVELFTIQCTTCRARLVVRDEAVIGDILACPKCSSMVHVVPPPGWNSTTVEVAPTDPAVWPPMHVAAAPASPPAKAKAAAVIPPALPPRPAPAQPAAVAAAQISAPPVVAATKVVAGPPLLAQATSAAAPPISTAGPPPVPSMAATADVAAKSLAGAKVAAPRWAALTNWARQEWKFLAGGLGAGVALGGTVWLILALQAPKVPPADELSMDVPTGAATATEAAPPSNSGVGQTPAPKVPVEAVVESAVAKEEARAAADRPDQPRNSIDPSPTANQSTDEEETALSPPAVSPPEETGDKKPPVASAPRPTIKLDPAPAEVAESTAPTEAAAESIIDSGAADDSAETPSEASAPADSPGAERPAITAAEVADRLSRALPSAQFTKVPLFQFVDFIAEFTSLPIQLDEPALKRVGKSRQSTVTVKLNQTTAGDALRAALSELGLVTSLREGVVVVTAAPNAKAAE
jgi:hypothetical protein